MTFRRISLALLAAVAARGTLAPDAFAQGCAMCGTAFSGDDPVARAFNWSVLFLIAMPYTVFGLAAGWLVLAHRRRGGRRRAQVITLPRARQVPAPAGGPKES
jgi:ABC-type sulfate transport system permease subunit